VLPIQEREARAAVWRGNEERQLRAVTAAAAEAEAEAMHGSESFAGGRRRRTGSKRVVRRRVCDVESKTGRRRTGGNWPTENFDAAQQLVQFGDGMRRRQTTTGRRASRPEAMSTPWPRRQCSTE